MGGRKKRLLIIGGWEEQLPAYVLAKKMGLEVLGSDMNPQAEAFPYADVAIIASTRDPEETAAAAKKLHDKNPIDGVMTIASDVPKTVVRVAQALGLRAMSMETATRATDKLAQLECFQKAGVPVPPFRTLESVGELKAVARDFGFPLIIKPIDQRGARGVLRLTESTDLQWAFKQALGHTQKGLLLAEPFVVGRQLSSESIVLRGKPHVNAFSDRNYEYLERFAPHIIENGGAFPAHLSKDEHDMLVEVIGGAARAIGLDEGPFKGDLVLSEGGEPSVIEFAARLGGGYASSHTIPRVYGVNLVEKVIKLALGEPVTEQELEATPKEHAVLRFFFPPEGVVREVSGFDALEAEPWVLLTKCYSKKGASLGKVSDHTRRAGCVLVVGDSRELAHGRAQEALRRVRFTMDLSEGLPS